MIVNSICGFIREMRKIARNNDTVIFFRGHSNESYKMEPSIFRPIGNSSGNSFVEKEHLMFRDFVARYDAEFRDCSYTMDFLVKMQHYDLPTRALDLTTDYRVALYFACLGPCDQNGEVIVFNIPKDNIRHYDSDQVSAISNLSKIDSIELTPHFLSFYKQASLVYDKFNHRSKNASCYCKRELFKKIRGTFKCITKCYIGCFNRHSDMKRLVHEVRKEKSYYQSIIDPNNFLSCVVPVIPKQNNQRVKNQSGAFLLFGLGKNYKGCYTKEKYPPVPDDWIVLGKRSNGTANRLIVDGCAKKKILKELAQMGITESFIFPEMDKYAKELKEKYS
ncbi:FRG domain-containing protein [Porphyromonas sp. COT-108 OH2963]|uniref:FRG domain-containing protein n=1 Tax=Porphyromonas sp. COT-108 OH2963 TaxID=1515614 RepID=UPI00055D37C9|nr:FRG domain-containing protein [Porphyromonas sp. COT-108 OH2963]